MGRENNRKPPMKPAAPMMQQNSPPKPAMHRTFEAFWSSCVKNGSPVIKNSFQAHLKAMGYENRPEMWISAAQHFGIPMEKGKGK